MIGINNPLCSSDAIHCMKIGLFYGKTRFLSPFPAIDEDASKVNIVHNPPVLLFINVAAREGEDCMRRALDKVEARGVSPSDCQVEESSEGERFVKIMGSLERDTAGESEGFMFADILQCAGLLPELC